MKRQISALACSLLCLTAAERSSARAVLEPIPVPRPSLDGAFADGPNLYAYVRQNPWSKFDPEGLFWDTLFDLGNVVHDVGRIVKNTAEVAYGAAATGYHKLTGNGSRADRAWSGMKADASELGTAAVDTMLDSGATLVPAFPAGLQKVARATLRAQQKYDRANAAANAAEAAANGDFVEAVTQGIEAGAKGKGKYGHLKEPKKVASGKETTQAQRKRILEENRAQNGGVVRSDKSGVELTPTKQLKKGDKRDDNEANIDHINPRSKGGSNSNTNLQVLSFRENLEKRSSTE